MPSPFATELFVRLFGVMPAPPKAPQHPRGAPGTEILVPNRPAKPGEKVIFHVTQRGKDERWAVRREGGTRPSAVCETKDEAVARAREIAANLPWSQVLIHNRDGKIAQEFAHGGPDSGVISDWEAPEETDRGMDQTEVPTSREKRITARVERPDGRKDTRRVVWHVTPRAEDGKWRVKRQGSSKPTRVISKKDEAVRAAKELARGRKRGQVVVHGADGKIAEEFRFGDS